MSEECFNVHTEPHETAGSVYFKSDINEGICQNVEISTEPELPVIDPDEVILAETGTFEFTEVKQRSHIESPITHTISESPDVETISDFVLSYDTNSTFTLSTSTSEDTPVESGNLPHFGDIDKGLEAISPESSSDIEISSILAASSNYTLYQEDVADAGDIEVPMMFPEPEQVVRHFLSDADHSSPQSLHRHKVKDTATSIDSVLPGPSPFRFGREVEGLTESEMVKRELQLAVQLKRLSRGESELVLEKEEPKKYEVCIHKC